MHEIEANRRAWGLLTEDHYQTFRKALQTRPILLSETIRKELGDLRGKSLLHLQCNTGADTISLARLGARVTGVDLVPENTAAARRLAAECGVEARFLEADIMSLADLHKERYDVVFTSEGAIGWLPDLRRWGLTIRQLLHDDGFFYAYDSHPFTLAFDETRLSAGELVVRYPYFGKTPDRSETIGGYAGPPRQGENYFWMYTIGDLLNSLLEAGLSLEWFHEFDTLFYNMGGMTKLPDGSYHYPHFQGRLPFSFSLKATVR